MSFRSNIQVKDSLIISSNLYKTDLRFPCLTLIIVGFSFLEGLAQHPLDVEGTIFSKKSTPGYNILTTNTDESSQCDLTMYNNSSALTILHYGTNHPSEARSSAIRFTQDLIFSRTDGMERMRIH